MGTVTLRAFIDVKNATTETDETNNQATLSYRTGRPDFTVKSVSLSPASPAAGKTFIAYVTVVNAGEVAGDAGTLDAWANSSAVPWDWGRVGTHVKFGRVGQARPRRLLTIGVPGGT